MRAEAKTLEAVRAALRAAGRELHDHVASPLAGAGLQLQMLCADHPEAADAAAPVLQALEEIMDRVRRLSQELNPPP